MNNLRQTKRYIDADLAQVKKLKSENSLLEDTIRNRHRKMDIVIVDKNGLTRRQGLDNGRLRYLTLKEFTDGLKQNHAKVHYQRPSKARAFSSVAKFLRKQGVTALGLTTSAVGSGLFIPSTAAQAAAFDLQEPPGDYGPVETQK